MTILQNEFEKLGWEIIRGAADIKSSSENEILRQWEQVITDMVLSKEDKRVMFPGYCAVCGREVDFLLDDMYSGGGRKLSGTLSLPRMSS